MTIFGHDTILVTQSVVTGPSMPSFLPSVVTGPADVIIFTQSVMTGPADVCIKLTSAHRM